MDHPYPSPLRPIPALEGLKTLALVMIVLRHAAYGFFMLSHNDDSFLTVAGVNLYPLFVNGWFWFDMLFVLCGFQAARTWFHNPGQPYKTYALGILRDFMPLYLIVIAISLAGVIPYYVPNGPVSATELLYHVILMQDILLPKINVFLATLAAEIKISLLLPFVLLACLRQRRPGQALAVAALFFWVAGFCFRLYGFSQYTPFETVSTNIYTFFVSCRLAFVYVMEPVILGAAIAWLCHYARPGAYSAAARCVFWVVLVLWALAAPVQDYLAQITWFDAVLQPALTALLMAGLVFAAVSGGLPAWFRVPATPRLFLPALLIHIPLVQPAYVAASTFVPATQPGTLFFMYAGFLLALTWALSVLLARITTR